VQAEEHCVESEEEEGFHGIESDAIVSPVAVVVHHKDTALALATVVDENVSFFLI